MNVTLRSGPGPAVGAGSPHPGQPSQRHLARWSMQHQPRGTRRPSAWRLHKGHW